MGERVIDRMRREIMAMWAPPPNIGVSQWAEENRFLSSETSSSTGKWKNDKAPYQTEIMDAFTQRGVKKIVMMSGAQCGKSEIIMNMIGRCIDLEPAPIMMVQPTQDTAEEFSKRRVSSMIECCPVLKKKVSESKSRNSSNTIGFKMFPGGSLSIVSAASAPALRSKPIRFLFMDEVDGYPISVGGEGDPVELATVRTETFHNAKIVMVSTPTNEDTSRIYDEYRQGTQEEWCVPCPACGAYSFMEFKDFQLDYEEYESAGKTQYIIKKILWRCPNCQAEWKESQMRKQKGKWIARNERALEKGVRSFHLNSFSSPWAGWRKIMNFWLNAKGDPEKEQAFTNLRLGDVWRGKDTKLTTPEELFARREDYSAEVPDGVLVLTLGVDTQDNRFEYEVVGWGRDEESWGIARGIIPGNPKHLNSAIWRDLDALIDRRWIRRDGQAMKILVTFIDSGGHCTDEIYAGCAARVHKRVFAIKGVPGESKEYVTMSSQMKKKKNMYLFLIGVDSGKAAVHYSLGVKQSGPYYSHFPAAEEAGYNRKYFEGLFAEKLEIRSRNGRQVLVWVRDKMVQARNEALDCRDYARAAFKGFNFDLNAIEDRLNGKKRIVHPQESAKKKRRGQPKVIDNGIQM